MMISKKIIPLFLTIVILFQPINSSASYNWGWSSTQNGYKFIVRVSFEDLVWLEDEQITVNWEIEWELTSSTHDWGSLQAYTYSLEIGYPGNSVSFYLDVDNSPTSSGSDSGTTLHTPPVTLAKDEWISPYMSVELVRSYDSDVSYVFGVGWVQIQDPSVGEPNISTTSETETVTSTKTITGQNITETETKTESLPGFTLISFLIPFFIILNLRKKNVTKGRK